MNINKLKNGITELTESFKIQNKHFSFTIDKKDGKVLEIINLYNGENVNSESGEFIYLKDFDKNKIPPEKLEAEGDEIKVTFKNGISLNMLIEVFENFVTAEITSELDKTVNSVFFANLVTKLTEVNSDEDFVLNAMGMTAWTNTVHSGYRIPAPNTFAQACTIFKKGVKGAKVGIVFSKKCDAIGYLKELSGAIDIKVGLTSVTGGPYAREWDGNYGDYAIIEDISPEKLDVNLAHAKEFCVDQYDIHQGYGLTFTQGSFEFAHTKSGSAKEYAETLGKKIKDAGLITALHTYAYYIDLKAESILSNPKWQKQLMTVGEHTLSQDIDGDATAIPTVEDASEFDLILVYSRPNMPYILVDEEIIKVVGTAENGFTECLRGQCGTKAVPHKKGSIAKQLTGRFVMFAPAYESELFYHVADLTAKAYNEGGFDMIYFDAIDGLASHKPCTRETSWYYFQMFIHRVLCQCERPPMIETSADSPQEWNIRGRSGAWDYPHFSIKKFVEQHVKSNVSAIERNNMTATLGWFNFFVDEHFWGYMKNTNFKTVFHDDLDYLGMNALIYDMGMVYHPLDSESINKNPFHYANIKYYTEHYTKLRKAHYFKSEVLEKVKNVGGEWRVISKGNEFAFQQMYYEKANVGKALDADTYTFSGKNPFGKQMPFIRIESRYSTLLEDPLTLAKSDKATQSEGHTVIPTEFSDIDKRCAMTMKIKGTGRDGDVALISLSGNIRGETDGRCDHFIDLSFDGWRNFILLDMDNADYDCEKYPFEDIIVTGAAYITFRRSANHFHIKQIAIRLLGDTANSAEFGDLISYPQTQAPIKNPSVKVGDSTVTFNCELHGGDYIEYDPETSKAILFHNTEQTTEEIDFTGMLTVDSGDFTASYSAETLSNAPLRAKVCLGFIGEELMN